MTTPIAWPRNTALTSRSSHIRKEELVQKVLAKRGDYPGLVHILSAMESCTAFKLWHDKNTHETFLKPTTGKCLHYYFYFIDELGGVVRLWALVMALSHSRMWSVIWSVRQDLLSWLNCHNRALLFLKGVAATVRLDNLSTGVASGAGSWAKLHAGYASYAKQLGLSDGDHGLV